MPASDVLLYENPYYPNPRRRRRSHRNPNILGSMKKVGSTMFGGLKPAEIAASVGGFALCAWVPGYIIKTVDTEWKKAGKVALSVALAVTSKVMLSKYNAGVANAAMYGGIAGAGALALKIYGEKNIINSKQVGGAPNVVPRFAPTPARPPSMGRATNEEFTPANQL